MEIGKCYEIKLGDIHFISKCISNDNFGAVLEDLYAFPDNSCSLMQQWTLTDKEVYDIRLLSDTESQIFLM